jgi:CHAT domain-containing protein/Tfp pilus assembly protein PilF
MNKGIRLQAIRTDASLDSAINFFESIRDLAIDGKDLTLSEKIYLDSLQLAALTRTGACYFWMKDYPRVLAVLTCALNEWKSKFGSEHPNVGNTLRIIADTYRKMNRWEESEKLYIEAITILEKAPDSIYIHTYRLGTAIRQFGWFYFVQSRYFDAEICWLREKDTWERFFGSEHFRSLDCLSNLFQVYIHTGQYSKAEQTARQQYELAEALLDSTSQSRLRLAGAANSLGRLFTSQGRDEEGELYLKKSMEIRIDVSGSKSQDAASGMGNLGWYYLSQKEYDQAEEYLSRALAIFEELYEQDKIKTISLGLFLSYMGSLCRQQERFTESETYYQRAIDVIEEHIGLNHTSLILPLTGLARLHLHERDLEKAKLFFARSISIQKELFGTIIPNHNDALLHLASIEHQLGNESESLNYFSEWVFSQYQFIRDAFVYVSEEQKLRYANKYSSVSNKFLSAALNRQDDSFLRASLDMVLKGKGLVLDALSQEREYAFCSKDSSLENKLRQHGLVCNSIASLTLSGSGRPDANVTVERIKNLINTKNRLEAEISLMCDKFDQYGSFDFEVAEVAAALPKGSVLWEFLEYRPYDFGKMGSGEEWKLPRYLAFVLDNHGSVRLIDLGEVYLVDSLIEEYSHTLQDAPNLIYNEKEAFSEANLADITSQLYEILFAPLAEQFDDCKSIYISPDGQLNLLSFDLLSSPNGKYVIEKYQISYLSSGRNLLKHKKESESLDDYTLLVANPDYFAFPDHTREQIIAYSAFDDGEIDRSRGPSKNSECLVDLFRQLPATSGEGEAITHILSSIYDWNIKSYYFENASEDVLKSIQSPPTVLHLATHGYYCSKVDFVRDSKFIDNPLLYSGLALAGANQLIQGKYDRADNPEDGILTSLEASGLNLVGTDLVVLSACQSGIGKVINGEGVYNLQRAFQQAGARSVVMSMFNIPDQSTAELMKRFYSYWLSGISKSAALRQSALNILSDRRQEHGTGHPLFWGGFVLVGNPY